ncbi:MAG: hypothetical protein GY882_03965 [Actinomycetia bacterium]|nr:hypothetical protein [Actinomycetes bacterium]MCP4843686.1 hypothetical protein [Actinomycetes bacterium]
MGYPNNKQYLAGFWFSALGCEEIPGNVQRQFFAWATREEHIGALEALAAHPSLIDEIDDELAKDSRAKVVVAWLSRPGRDHAAMAERAASEKRVTVLDAIAKTEGLDESVYMAVVKANKDTPLLTLLRASYVSDDVARAAALQLISNNAWDDRWHQVKGKLYPTLIAHVDRIPEMVPAIMVEWKVGIECLAGTNTVHSHRTAIPNFKAIRATSSERFFVNQAHKHLAPDAIERCIVEGHGGWASSINQHRGNMGHLAQRIRTGHHRPIAIARLITAVVNAGIDRSLLVELEEVVRKASEYCWKRIVESQSGSGPAMTTEGYADDLCTTLDVAAKLCKSLLDGGMAQRIERIGADERDRLLEVVGSPTNNGGNRLYGTADIDGFRAAARHPALDLEVAECLVDTNPQPGKCVAGLSQEQRVSLTRLVVENMVASGDMDAMSGLLAHSVTLYYEAQPLVLGAFVDLLDEADVAELFERTAKVLRHGTLGHRVSVLLRHPAAPEGFAGHAPINMVFAKGESWQSSNGLDADTLGSLWAYIGENMVDDRDWTRFEAIIEDNVFAMSIEDALRSIRRLRRAAA